MDRKTNRNIHRRFIAFTLIELMVVMAIIAVLITILVPVAGSVRDQARTSYCLSNLHQLDLAFIAYATEQRDYAIPAYNPTTNTYWWGKQTPVGIDHKQSVIYPYLRTELKENSVYECPSQPYGSYTQQHKPPGVSDSPAWITSTYGYNSYYLTPKASPWPDIRHRPWQKITTITRAELVIAFADTLLDRDTSGSQPRLENNALVDPPYIFNPRSGWVKNAHPTTCFRHDDSTCIAFADGHCGSETINEGSYTSVEGKIGSIGPDLGPASNNPHYVPDYSDWKPILRNRPRR